MAEQELNQQVQAKPEQTVQVQGLPDPKQANKKQKKQKVKKPKKEKKQSAKSQLPPKRRERKIIVLDHFNKRILNVVLATLILSIAVPVMVFSFVTPTKLVDVSLDKAVEYFAEVSKHQPDTLSYTYTNEGATYTKDYVFVNNVLTKRVTTTIADTSNTVVVVRKLELRDKDFIKANIPGYEEASDETIADYISTSTEYIEITNTLTDGEYVVTSQVLQTKTHLELEGATYQDILDGFGCSDTIASAQAYTKYNIFGLGYDYTDYVLTDDLGNIIAFKDGFVDSITKLDTTIVYDFSVNTLSYIDLAIESI